jgi:hypothetical protein
LRDAAFLESNFKDLLVDQEKTIKFAVLYSCNKVVSECHALAHKAGLKEIEKIVGKLQPWTGYEDDYDEDDYFNHEGEPPYQVDQIEGWTEAEHFILTSEQWKKLRYDEGCIGCELHLTIFTYKNVDFVDVKDILENMVVI